jgi:hypothetical protein
MTRRHDDEGIARLAAWAVRNRARALRNEIVRPWRRGRRTPEAEAGRWLGLGLAVGAAVFGIGLGILSALSED